MATRTPSARARSSMDNNSMFGSTIANLFTTRAGGLLGAQSDVASEAESSLLDRKFAEALGLGDDASMNLEGNSHGPIKNVGHRLYVVGCGREKLKQDQLAAERERIMLEEMASFTQRPAITTRARSKPSKGNSFADHAQLWSEKKQEHLMRLEHERIQQLQSQMQATPTINENCDRILTEYVGPVQGWNAHFAKFCAKQSPSLPPNMFKPNINANAIRVDGHKPIGERLFQDSFCRNQRREAQVSSHRERELQDPNTGRKLFSPQSFSMRSSREASGRNVSEVAVALHEASKSREERLSSLREVHKDPELTFSPTVNKLSRKIAPRAQKPLYEVKRSKSAEPAGETTPMRKERISAEKVRAFLLRNEKAERDKHNHVTEMRREMAAVKEAECSFQPRINPKSEEIFSASNVFGVPLSDSPLIVPTLWSGRQSNTPRSAAGSVTSPVPRVPGTAASPPSTTRQPFAPNTTPASGPVPAATSDHYISSFEQQMLSVLDEWKKLEDV